MDVVAAYREVGTLRGAADVCGTTHKTVKRILIRHHLLDCDEGGPAPAAARKERGHNYDGVEALVAKKVADTKGRISAKRLLPEARTAGYEGSARNFRRLVAAQKALWRQGNHRGRRPAVWTPGITLHAKAAARHCPSLQTKRVTAHVLRHTTAMRLLHAGVDIAVIALWLGHESIETTRIYLFADLDLKQKAIARTRPLGHPSDRYRPPDKLIAWLEAL
jgi:hypothetical protein